MSCAGSERAENTKGFDCENMGEVLGKECVKDESFTHSSEESVREVGKGSASSVETSGIEIDQDACEDSNDDDISWLLSFNKDELVTEKCKCEGCLRRNESCNEKKNNAEVLLSSWKELQSYIRNVYINSPLESAQRTEVVPIEENERLYEMIQIMRLCDPYQLFLKIEEEVQAMVMRSRNRQLSLLKHEFNPVLAGEFITGLIEEYVKLLSSALQLGPAIDILLMSQFQRFGLSWDMLNKHLYQSLVYNHTEVQNNLPRFISHLTVIPFKDDVYLELVHQYLAFDDEMASIAEAWEKIEPVIQKFKISKLRETETLNSLQDALKAFFASRPASVNGVDEVTDSPKTKNSRYCPNCLTMRGCPCDECTVTHMLTCEGIESPPVPNSPVASSKIPNKDKQAENREDVNGDQQQTCECHACAAPPPELMDCSVAFGQINSKNSQREGFQLYPHIHGTVAESIYEAENISGIYPSIQATPDSVYPHLYNLQSQTNSVIKRTGVIPNRSQPAQSVQPVQSAQTVQPAQPILSVQPVQSPKTVQSTKSPQPVQPVQSAKSPQPVQPVQSVKPTQPTQPAQSAQPVQPVQSAKSAQPVQSVQSVKPTQSAKSAQPVQPVQSVKPTQSVKSAQPAQPVQSVKPAQSAQPVQPVLSAKPAQSAQPVQPAQSTKSAKSTQSTQSTQSAQPAPKPTQSTQSTQPAPKPTQSTQSVKPTQSAKSAQPVQPVQTAKPTQSTQSAKPVQSTQSTQSAKPTQSTQPAKSTKSTQSTQSVKPPQAIKSARCVQIVQTIQSVSVKKIQPLSAANAQHEKSRVITSVSVNTQAQSLNCPPPFPPPSHNAPSSARSAAPKDKGTDKATMTNISVKPVPPKQMPTAVKSDSNKRPIIDGTKPATVKVDDKKSQTANKATSARENEGPVKAGAEKAKLLSSTTCVKSSLCGKCCLRHGPNCLKTPSCGKSTDKHLAAIARLGYSTTINARGTLRGVPGKDGDHTHKPGKGHSCGKLKGHDIGRRIVNGKLNGQEPDDSSSQDDTCSERSNSTSASTQRDTRHCDCCYCEVFGHGVPQVAPVSRNYQEMRERLRLKLNMKKSAKSKSGAQGSEAGTTPSTANSQDAGKKNAPKEKDLESLLKFIEGKTREACKDPKRLAKRARQKQKKLEEKERMEEEAERKRVEALKKAQAAKQNQAQQSGKQQQQQQQQQQPNSKNAQSNNSGKNRSNTGTSNNQPRSNQTLNLSGLKSLVEKSDPNSGPKMVTIRRVMAPFSAEPTVTITLKGSTPDKDKVLFMLKNGSEAYQPEDNSKKGKKNKKKAKKEMEYYEEEEEAELLYEEEPEPVAEKAGSKKKKKNKNKKAEVVENNVKSNRSVNQPESSKGTVAETSKNSKNKNSKNNSSVSTSNTVKNQTQAVNKSKSSNTNVSVKSSQNSSATQVSNSKGKSQKNVPVLKPQNQNVKNQNNSNNKNISKNANATSTKNSGRNNNNNNINNNVSNNNSNSANSKNSSSAKGSARNSNAGNNVTAKNGKNNQKPSAVSGANEKSVVNQSGKNQAANAKQSKNKKGEENSQRQAPNVQTKGKANDPKPKTAQKAGKSANENVQKAQPKQEVKQNVQKKEKQKENVKTVKNSQKPVMENGDMNARFSMGGGYERGKVVINTPSYRLSEVLSSIAPSPPPKEEINLENLRLPPGITITKIEGPINKPVRGNDQPSHVSKPVPPSSPIVVSTPTLKPSHTTPPGNVIVVDTGRLKEVIQENSPNLPPTQSATSSKKKKKKNKQNAENMVPSMEIPMSQNSAYDMKLSQSNPVLGKGGVTVISPDEARKMVPNLENQQATIIKTSDNMVTIRSPAFQQAMNMQAYQNSSNFRPGVNGYNNVTLFQNDVNRITDSIGKFSLNPEDKLARQMRNLNIKEGSRAGEIFAQAMSVAGQNGQDPAKKRKKKRKSGNNRSDEKEVEPVESVFQPKDIDLENGDIDDDERELEAFKRFCLQSVPSERKNKVKVNLNIKDIVLKKKSSAVGCS